MAPAELLSLLSLLSHRPLGLVTDLDGTISPIAATPQRARVSPRCRRLLGELAGRLELVAVLSGRAAAEAQRLVGVEGLVYVGHHGLSRWHQGQEALLPEAEPFAAQVAQARRELAPLLEQVPGLLLEDKGLALALHYRQSTNPSQARRAILGALAASPAGRGLALQEGRRVLELRPPLADKGRALEGLVAEYGLRGVIYLGDDLTDVDAFRALGRLRQAGSVAGLAVAVAGWEAPASLLEGADLSVAGVAGVAALLAELLGALKGGAGEPGGR